MMKLLSCKITSVHLLLCVFLSLLLGVTDSSTNSSTDETQKTTVTKATEAVKTKFKSAKQTETSITLQWNKVNVSFNYTFEFNGKEINVTASEGKLVTHTITELTSAPRNTEEFKSVGQNETSITLQWKKVNSILNYVLEFNGKVINVTALEGQEHVTDTIMELTSGTKYDFSLFTVFENVTSSGVDITAVTAPRNTEEFKSVGQNETSINLQWKKVNGILNYVLEFNGNEINVTASEGQEHVTHTIMELTSGTKYNFSLFTVFENVRSSGVDITAVTAPRNSEEFKSVGQNETSITLQWKKVKEALSYIILFNGNEINVTASDRQEHVTHTIMELTSGTKYDFSLFTVFENVTSSGVNITAVTAPRNSEEFKSVGQNETSITLQWKKVNGILNYVLEFNGKVINVTASEGQEHVTHTIMELTSGTKYNFSLFTVFENVRSSGVDITAVTAPRNSEEFKSVGQNETSITLQWKKVKEALSYIILFNGNEINVTASDRQEHVTHTIMELTSGTKYNFSLFTVFENVRSSGVDITAVTAPRNSEEFKSVGQNETSITLQWKKVKEALSYIILFNGNEINVTASDRQEHVTHTIMELTSGTKYDFSLFTVFENVRSSGVNITAVTAPRNTEEFKSVGQNETSITLQWKKVNGILNYVLEFNGKVINVTASEGQEHVTHTIMELTSGTKYDFSLFTVFENVTSSGVDITAVTAPRNSEEFKSVGQNETSITLQWKKVNGTFSYIILFNGNEINVTASEGQEHVTHTIIELTSGTKYDFSLFTVFENVRSSGVNITAVTAPRNTEEFKSVGQNETSITLQWKKVKEALSYIILFNGNEINVTASEGQEHVTHTIMELTSGTKYNFSLFTVFENVRSSGVDITAVTAPRNTEEFKSVGQNETSITLQWKKVNGILNYVLEFNGKVINVTASEGQEHVTHTIMELTSGTKYNFSLFTVFENVRSSGVDITAVTAPRNTEEFKSVGQNETSINLQWKKVNGILNYVLEFNGKVINVTASEGQEHVTHTIMELTSGTKYNFSLFTVFENVRSSGVDITAVTAPRNSEEFKSVGQTETSINLQWKKVNGILSYIILFNGKVINVTASEGQEHVTRTIVELTSGTKYDFSLFTVFENVRSSGVNITAVTVPTMVALVNVTERSVTSVTLQWNVDVEKNWNYTLQINGETFQVPQNGSLNVVSQSSQSLQPGTEYAFSVTTVFSGLKSTPYKGFIVTAIDCTNVSWHVTNLSIQGVIEGLFSNATATNKSQTHVSPGGRNVSFSGLYPGATYTVSLVYERNSTRFQQCSHNLTIIPPDLSAHCEYWAAGYSVFIVWNKPAGVWTSVEVNVTGKTHKVENGEQHIKISGFLPARTYEVSLASLSGTVRSYKPIVFSCPTDPRGVIAGSVFAVLLFGLLVGLIVLIMLKRPDIISRRKMFIGGSILSNKKCIAIPVTKFPDHFYQLSADENRGFSEEYENLIPVGTEQTRKEAVLPENKARNRFNNVLPYDWCRVKLTTSNSNGTSDYINANYMPGYNSNREYIATQGPLPYTVNDFWRMIWEQRVKRIVMVTNCTEGGRTKCEQYWPADSRPCLHGELLVTITSVQQEPNWTLREFRMKHRNTSEERMVKHFHFTAWPDHGVPQGTEVLIQFRGLVRQHIEKEGTGAPTVVHCSAGVGRTGTIIALDVLLQQLGKERAVDINGFVHKMRLCRPYMVQTESQYVFLHQCIMDSLQAHDKLEENIYENSDMIYANATALQEFHSNA